jgi:hypothetical protein
MVMKRRFFGREGEDEAVVVGAGEFRLAEDAGRGGAKKEARVVCPVEDLEGLPLFLGWDAWDDCKGWEDVEGVGRFAKELEDDGGIPLEGGEWLSVRSMASEGRGGREVGGTSLG